MQPGEKLTTCGKHRNLKNYNEVGFESCRPTWGQTRIHKDVGNKRVAATPPCEIHRVHAHVCFAYRQKPLEAVQSLLGLLYA